MADEFPTLEAVAALGVVALSVRVVLMAQQVSAIRRDNAALVDALRSGAHQRAVELCARAKSPAYSEIARRILSVLEERGKRLEPQRFKERVDQAAQSAFVRTTRRVQSGRARDLILLAVLFGSLAYAFAGGLNAGAWFLMLVAAACLIVIGSFVLRSKVSSTLASCLGELLSAAATSQATAPEAVSDGRCRNCGRAEQIVVSNAAALGPSPWGLGVEELRICRNCGVLHGKVRDPDRIPIGPAHGTALAVTLDPGEMDLASNPREHEG
jgi:hypothetical protein